MIIFSILVFIIIFSVLILVHEWGHYYAAVKSGVKVEEFGMGFGKRVWGFKRGETEFNLNLIPFGGFVRMLGEEEESDDPRSFEQAKLWKRMVITLAGVFMNWVFAVIALAALFAHGVNPILISQQDIQNALRDGYLIETEASTEEAPKYKFVQKIQMPIHEAIPFAFVETGRISRAVLQKVSEIPGEIIREKRFPEGLTGPIGIAEVTHKIMPYGFWELLKLTALLSISLAVMNLLPIPALDGGRFLLQIAELCLRHKPNQKWEQALHMGGFFVLIGLLLAVTYNDIVRIFF